jgi:hypothetical protein
LKRKRNHYLKWESKSSLLHLISGNKKSVAERGGKSDTLKTGRMGRISIKRASQLSQLTTAAFKNPLPSSCQSTAPDAGWPVTPPALSMVACFRVCRALC